MWVLILVNKIHNYLSTQFSRILAVAMTDGGGVSMDMLGWLTTQGYDLLHLGYQTNEWGNTAGMGRYISVHYEDLGSIVSEQLGALHPLAQFLNRYAGPTLYEILKGLTRQDNKLSTWALDVGANVGGMVWHLSQHYEFVWGLDYGFQQVLTARRILLHQPSPLLKYRLYHEGLRFTERNIQVTNCSNVEVIVSTGEQMPFVEAQFQLVTCANVIDIVSNPNNLVQECLRVLRGVGKLFLLILTTGASIELLWMTGIRLRREPVHKAYESIC